MKIPQAGQHETAIGTHGKNHKQSETNRTRRNNLHDKIRYKVGITKQDPTQITYSSQKDTTKPGHQTYQQQTNRN